MFGAIHKVIGVLTLQLEKDETMKRTISAVLIAGALLLGGCADSTDNMSEPTTESATEAAKTEYANVGDTIPIDCVGGECRGELKVEEIQLGGECKAPLMAEELSGDMQLLQISGIVSATTEVKDDKGAELGVIPEGPVAWDNEGFKTTGEWGGGCDIPQQYEQWGTLPTKVGEKVRMYGAFLIPKNAKELGIANSKFDLTKIEASPSTSAAAASAPDEAPSAEEELSVQSSVSAVPMAPAEDPAEEPVIGYTEAPGQVEPHVMEKQIASCGDPSIHETGTTFFTDGTSGWTQNCASQMM